MVSYEPTNNFWVYFSEEYKTCNENHMNQKTIFQNILYVTRKLNIPYLFFIYILYNNLLYGAIAVGSLQEQKKYGTHFTSKKSWKIGNKLF